MSHRIFSDTESSQRWRAEGAVADGKIRTSSEEAGVEIFILAPSRGWNFTELDIAETHHDPGDRDADHLLEGEWGEDGLE